MVANLQPCLHNGFKHMAPLVFLKCDHYITSLHYVKRYLLSSLGMVSLKGLFMLLIRLDIPYDAECFVDKFAAQHQPDPRRRQLHHSF